MLAKPIPPQAGEIPDEKQWVFDSQVANVFDDMAARSIPGYHSTQQLSVSLARQFAQTNSIIIDVGSATGTTMIALAQGLQDKSIQIIGVEPSEPMRMIALDKCKQAKVDHLTNVVAGTAESLEFENASLVLFNYTLHFVPRSLRQGVLDKVFKGLRQGGLVILAEKLNYTDSKTAAGIRKAYYRFKALNGYSEREILEKEHALQNVLCPLTLSENLQLLRDAGFSKVEVAFTAPPFATMIGWKGS
jgi:tRNA (cmo5U34)-methyltransferase